MEQGGSGGGVAEKSRRDGGVPAWRFVVLSAAAAFWRAAAPTIGRTTVAAKAQQLPSGYKRPMP